MKRALTVPKSREQARSNLAVREFKILPEGVVLGDELEYGRDIG